MTKFASTDDAALLLAAILADPADDTSRLVYADWLEENGDEARAEFIRVQIKLAQMPEQFDAEWENGYCTVCGEDESPSSHYHCLECGELCGMMGCGKESCKEQAMRREQLRARERELDPDLCGFVAGLPELPGRDANGRHGFYTFSRGFVAHVTATATDWLKHGPKIVREQPVERVTLSDCEPTTEDHNDRDPFHWYYVAGYRNHSQDRPRHYVPSRLMWHADRAALNPSLSEIYEFRTEADALDWLSAACLAYAHA